MNVDTPQLAAITDRVSTLEATAAAADQRIAALSACLEAAYHAAGMPVPSPAPMIPPNSSAVRELLTTIVRGLELPPPATVHDEVTYLRCSRNRARCVLWACKSALYRDNDDTDLMTLVVSLREP
jgi:hypothetical protein